MQNNIVGVLLVKDLIFVDPEDGTRVADFVEIFGRNLAMVWPDSKLGDVLRELKTGRSHMGLVRDVNNQDPTQDPFYEVKGIITLEDIIEEILGDEIVDETDAFVDGTQTKPVDRAQTFQWARLRLLDRKIVEQRLSQDEVRAVTAHFSRNFPEVVAGLTEDQLHRLIAETIISSLPVATQEIGEKLPIDLMYRKAQPTNTCTMILAGKVTVLAGEEEFRSDVSSFSLLGAKALSDETYRPDFNAFVSSGPCRCLRITRERFEEAKKSSKEEMQLGLAKDDIDSARLNHAEASTGNLSDKTAPRRGHKAGRGELASLHMMSSDSLPGVSTGGSNDGGDDHTLQATTETEVNNE